MKTCVLLSIHIIAETVVVWGQWLHSDCDGCGVISPALTVTPLWGIGLWLPELAACFPLRASAMRWSWSLCGLLKSAGYLEEFYMFSTFSKVLSTHPKSLQK